MSGSEGLQARETSTFTPIGFGQADQDVLSRPRNRRFAPRDQAESLTANGSRMRPARRRRTIEAVALSVAVHAALIAVLAVYAPRLALPPSERGPPEAVIPVLIMPRTPPAAVANPGARPSPIHLH